MSRDVRDATDHHLQKVKVQHRIKSRTVKGKNSRKLFRRHTTPNIPVDGSWGGEEGRGGERRGEGRSVRLTGIEPLNIEPKQEERERTGEERGEGERKEERQDMTDSTFPLISSKTVLVETSI